MKTIQKPFRLFFVLLLSAMMVLAMIPPLAVSAEPSEYTIPDGQTVDLSSLPSSADVKLAGSAVILIDCNKTLNSITYTGKNYTTDTLTFKPKGTAYVLHVSESVAVPNLTVDAANTIYFENNLYVQRSPSDHGETGTLLFKNGEVHIWGDVEYGKKLEISKPAYITVGGGINTWNSATNSYYIQTGGTMLIGRGIVGPYTVNITGGILRTGRKDTSAAVGINALYFRMTGGEGEA